MIARMWKGWTPRENADAYERLLRDKVLPGLRSIDGYLGAPWWRYARRRPYRPRPAAQSPARSGTAS